MAGRRVLTDNLGHRPSHQDDTEQEEKKEDAREDNNCDLEEEESESFPINKHRFCADVAK